jgi:hypothetical protein
MVELTSIIAYHKIKENNLLSKKRMEVYEALIKFGPCSSGELIKYAKLQKDGIPVQARARLNELEERKVAEVIETRPCKITGNKVKIYRVIDALPVNPQRPEKIRPKGYVKCVEYMIKVMKQTNTKLFTLAALETHLTKVKSDDHSH